jgi:hypothetical protein
MKHRVRLSMAIGVIGPHGRIAFAGDAAGDLDNRTINSNRSRATNLRGRGGAPATQGS